MEILRYASFLWSMFHALVIFLIFFEPRCSMRLSLLISCTAIGGLLAGNVLIIYMFGFDIFMDIGFFTCTFPSLFLFLALSKYRDGRFYFLFCFCDTCSIWIMLLSNVLDRLTGSTYVVMLVSRLILCPVAEFFFWRFLRRPYQELQSKLDQGWWAFTMVAGVYYLLCYVISFPTDGPITDPLYLARILLVLILMPLTYLTILRALWQQIQIFEDRWQLDLQRQNYSVLCQKIELGRVYRHDIRHHLLVLDGLLQQGQGESAREYVQALSGKLASLAQAVWCGNTAVNAVLAAYIAQAEESGCRVSAKVNVPAQLPYEDVPLCILLANVLENAVQACREVPKPERRLFLEVELTGNQRFSIQIENPCARLVELGEDGLPVGSHKGEGHGLGLHSVKGIVDRYGGLLRCQCEDGVFRLKAVLFPPAGGAAEEREQLKASG